MPHLRTIATPGDRRRFVEFVYRLYAGNACFKDPQVHIARLFLNRSDSFTRACDIRPVTVEEGGRILCEAVFVYHRGLPALQVAFFEALPGQSAAVEVLLEAALQDARRRGLPRVVIGLNGHVCYGVGFLVNRHDEPISFDSVYTPPYYADYFEARGYTAATLSTYRVQPDSVRLDPALAARAAAAIRFRTMEPRRYGRECELLGRLCNACLAGTPLYFERPPGAMRELLAPLRPLLRPENLIFALKDGREIGFLFWHPDYNQVLAGGVRNSLAKLLLLYGLRRRRIDRFKLNAVGVLPEHRGGAALMGLVQQTRGYTAGRYREGETNFVWDSNVASTRFNRHVMGGVCRRYRVYEASCPAGPGGGPPE